VHRVVQQRTIEMVDHTGAAHFLTVDAAADGLPRGRYTAVCSEEILRTGSTGGSVGNTRGEGIPLFLGEASSSGRA
jgi:hypothetical protein